MKIKRVSVKNSLMLGIALCIFSSVAFSQSKQTIQTRQYCRSQEHVIMAEFVSFLSIPNVASDSVNIRRNAAFIMDMMRTRGISNVRLLEANSKTTPPVVFGEVKVADAKQTLIFYAHYDGQPVNPQQWAPGIEPFKPKLFSSSLDDNGKPVDYPDKAGNYDLQWRLYARGASDDKAGVAAILNAYSAVVSTKQKLNYNIKFFFEGEEEAGSPHLNEILEKHAALLQSDLWIICDGPVHQTGRKVISFGVRGDAHLDLTVYGPKRPLHSGHYGNWAPNPGMTLAKLLSTMKNDEGMVTIKGFYEDVKPLTEAELNALKKMPAIEEQMKTELGLAVTESDGRSLAEAITLPSLNINGMQSGNVGAMASNVIPTEAKAILDLRLVLGNDWQRQQQKVVEHIKLQGFHVIDHEPTDEERMTFGKLVKVIPKNDGYNAQRTSMSLPIAAKIVDAVQSSSADPLVLIPTSGGSLPLYVFEKYLKANTISVPIANHDNNQHAENENIRLSNFFAGIETMAAVMSMK
jgi:acetylornithine deacetylase/succinyl-diaminopimelate desuccinylase-like protein